MIVGVSNPKTNFGVATNTSTADRHRRVCDTPSMRSKMATAARSEMGTTARRKMRAAAPTTATPLGPHGERQENEAKRRDRQPAPHNRIIAQFDLFSDGEKCARTP